MVRTRRTAERGATLFVVVLVFTLLFGIGAFAARSAHLATASSGFARQQTQVRYVAEYGMMMATSLLAGSGGQTYMRAITRPPATELCRGQTTAMPARTCYRLSYAEVDKLVHDNGGFALCEPASWTSNQPTAAGSLGLVQARCDFVVELSDKVQGATPAGFDTGPGNPLKFFYLTATTTALVRLLDTNDTPAGTLTTPETFESSSMQTLRGRILMGPIAP